MKPVSVLPRVCLGLIACLYAFEVSPGSSAQTNPAPTAPGRQVPELKIRPLPAPGAETVKEGRIHLDVVVTDKSGKPVSGLAQDDFTVFDNNQPQTLISFAALNGQSQEPAAPPQAPPVEVILLLDTVNTDLDHVNQAREGVEKFLNQNDGHLKQPTSVIWLTDAGVRILPRPTIDGHALADLVHQVPPTVHTIHAAAGAEGQLERLQLCIRTLSAIANNESKRPGRKVLIWTGPGWPTLWGQPVLDSNQGHAMNFGAIISLSTGMRLARLELCAPSSGPEFFVKNFLKGIRSAKEAGSGNLAMEVLAVHSGGRSLDAGNGSRMADQVSDCAADAGAYYAVSFDPPKAAVADEYHDLRVAIKKPGLIARTTTGYYNQPQP